MTLALVALAALLICGLVAINCAYIRHLEAKDRRHDDQVGRLLQRIQAPDRAVIEHAIGDTPVGPEHVGIDDDAAFWEARGIEVPS